MTYSVAVVLIALVSLLVLYVVIIAYLILSNRLNNRKQKRLATFNQNDYLIVFASQSGQAENIAQQTAQQLHAVVQKVSLVYM